MAQYADIIAGLTDGVGVPTGFTQRFTGSSVTYTVADSVDAPGGKKLTIAHTAAARNFISRDEINADAGRATCEQLVMLRQTGSSATQSFAGPADRAEGSSGSETASCGVLATQSGPRLIRIIQYDSPSSPVLTNSSGSNTWESGVIYFLKKVTSGSSTTLQLLANDSGVPGAELDTVTASATAANSTDWIGLFSFASDTDSEILYYSVGTNGDTAPLPGSGITVAVGAATETDAANTISSGQITVSVGTAAESDAANAITTSAVPALEINELLYSDDAKTTLVTDTGYAAYVLDPSDNTLSKYFASVDITSGVVRIEDALYTTPTDTFEVALIKGNIRGVFPATVVSS